MKFASLLFALALLLPAPAYALPSGSHVELHAAFGAGEKPKPVVGRPLSFTLRLFDGEGKVLTEDRLKLAHTQRIHLLIVDDTLTDYQHVHPVAAGAPGSYAASFTPRRAGDYTVWIDAVPVGGEPQFLPRRLHGQTPCAAKSCVAENVSMTSEAGGLKATLSFGDVLKANMMNEATVKITTAKGKPVKDLEPVMGAFAHIVGFTGDLRAVVHAHPLGVEPKSAKSRGGPALAFHFAPDRPGFVRMFVQVRRGGKDIFLPFGVTAQ